MDNFVITIARQYGSGGRTIGEELAKKLGISYYDKDIIRMASEESGIHEQLFGRADENVSTKQRFFAKSGIYKGELIPPQSKDFTSDENLFNYQAKIIRELAGKESCVIIGRCSNYILKDYPNVLRVFIHADWNFRMEKAAEKLSTQGVDAEIIDLRSIKPLDEETILKSVKKTGHLIIVHEAVRTNGFGAEIAATIAEKGFADLKAPIIRVTAPDCPSPFTPVLEHEYLPNADKIVAAAIKSLSR